MYSKRTNDLWKFYQASRKEDFNVWLPKVIAEDIQVYIEPIIRYVRFNMGSEYDDQGGYYSTVSSVHFYTEDQISIDLDEEHNWKQEFREGGSRCDEIINFDEVNDIFDEYARDLNELGIDEDYIDLKVGIK